MASQRDPAKYWLPIANFGFQLVLGVLFVLHRDDVFLTVVGVLMVVIGALGLTLSLRRYRREKARTD